MADAAAVGGGGRGTGVRDIPLRAVEHGHGSNSRHWGLPLQPRCPTSEGAEPAQACWLLPPRWGILAGPRRPCWEDGEFPFGRPAVAG